MRFLKSILPNITIALAITVMVIFILDRRNPMMGFLMGTPALVVILALCVSACVTSLVLYLDWRRK